MRVLAPSFLFFACSMPSLTAQTVRIVPDHFPTIDAAIQAAAPGDVVHVRTQPTPYPPFTIDRPVAIVGSAIDGQAPTVGVAAGAAITVNLQPGQRASVTRIDAAPTSGATLTKAVVANGGHLTLEDCRFLAGHDPAGNTGLAGVDVTDTDLVLLFTRIEGGTAAAALRATTSRVSLVSSRCFGANPNGAGVVVQDSTLHGNDAWLLGGENFLNAAGGPALVVGGASQVWLTDSTVRSGMGSPAGSAIVNSTATPVELRATVPTLALSFGGATPPPVVVGPTVVNPNLLRLRWSEQLYRRGTLRLGQPWFVHTTGPANTPVLLAFSFAPSATAALVTRQPALLPGDVAAMFLLLTDPSGTASFGGSVPNTAALVGAGLWAQSIAGTGLPFEASPFAGAVVRPY
ncbi:MAG: hypothetical protein JNK15_13275 [Planctomycetes bacterium]|nr:hypothetical protein [Planctomycetota bacterium]